MVKGFYQLGSGMFTQNKKLNTITNNIANSQTDGYKKQVTIATTFGNMVMSRVDGNYTEIGSTSFSTVVDENAAIHTQGSLISSERRLDFAISGEGFFAVESNGNRVYTRNGSFNLDQDGYLVTGFGDRVLGRDGAPVYVGTSDFSCDDSGNIFVDGAIRSSIGIYNFADYKTLSPNGNGYYTAGGNPELVQNPTVLSQKLEKSNVDMAEEMVEAISAQRGFQFCTEALRVYDDILSDATTQLGKIN